MPLLAHVLQARVLGSDGRESIGWRSLFFFTERQDQEPTRDDPPVLNSSLSWFRERPVGTLSAVFEAGLTRLDERDFCQGDLPFEALEHRALRASPLRSTSIAIATSSLGHRASHRA